MIGSDPMCASPLPLGSGGCLTPMRGGVPAERCASLSQDYSKCQDARGYSLHGDKPFGLTSPIFAADRACQVSARIRTGLGQLKSALRTQMSSTLWMQATQLLSSGLARAPRVAEDGKTLSEYRYHNSNQTNLGLINTLSALP